MSFFGGITDALGNAAGAVGGTIGGTLGLGSNQGSKFKATPANVLQPTDVEQIQRNYNNAQSGIAQQQAFLNAITAQNGLQNQSNVFNQMQGTAGQLQGIADGTGPNPAMAQLNQTTGANIANQAALMAGQRGTASNAGLLARQAAMQGANLQQQAVGQGATMQANQSLGAIGALQGQQAAMANLAGSQVNQNQNALSGYNQASQNEQQQLLSALGNFNNANVSNQSNVNNANAGIANTIAQGQTGLVGGLLGGGGAAAAKGGMPAGAAAGAYRGGVVKSYADGGAVNVTPPQSFAGRYLQGWSSDGSGVSAPSMGAPQFSSNPFAQDLEKNVSNATSGLRQNLKNATNVNFQAKGGPISGEQLASMGQAVPGKASVKGDSLKNDTVPAMLSAGEIVLPRHITQAANAPEKAKAFVEAILAKQGMRKKA